MNYFEKEISKAASEVIKNVAQDIVRPTSHSIGKNIGLLVDGVMGWLGCWGQKQKIKQAANIQTYKEMIASKILSIPHEKLCEPQTNIVGPAVEASKFYLEEDYYKNMFSNLIAASCNVSFSNIIHPAFVEIIKQLSPLDAKLLSTFKHATYPVADIYEQHADGIITPYNQCLFDFLDCGISFDNTEIIRLTSSLDNLIRLGLVLKNNKVLQKDYDYLKEFEKNWLYRISKKSIEASSSIKIRKYRIELTEFGRSFTKCCF